MFKWEINNWCYKLPKILQYTAILFSDILLLPHLLGQKVTFKEKIGPVLKEININEKFLKKEIDLSDFLSIKNAISKIKNITTIKRSYRFLWCSLDNSLLYDEGGSSKDSPEQEHFYGTMKKFFLN